MIFASERFFGSLGSRSTAPFHRPRGPSSIISATARKPQAAIAADQNHPAVQPAWSMTRSAIKPADTAMPKPTPPKCMACRSLRSLRPDG